MSEEICHFPCCDVYEFGRFSNSDGSNLVAVMCSLRTLDAIPNHLEFMGFIMPIGVHLHSSICFANKILNHNECYRSEASQRWPDEYKYGSHFRFSPRTPTFYSIHTNGMIVKKRPSYFVMTDVLFI